MAWKTKNGKRIYIPDGNMSVHEARENRVIKNAQNQVKRLKDPKNRMNPYAKKFALNELEKELKQLQKINGVR